MQSFIEYHRNKMIKIENATFCYGMLHFFLPCNTYFGSRKKNFRGSEKNFELFYSLYTILFYIFRAFYFIFFERLILRFSNNIFLKAVLS